MTPSARLQAVIDILQALDTTGQPADRFLRDWARARRYAGSKDRAAVAERLYAILRHRSSLAWQMGCREARALVIASLAREGLSPESIAQLFDGSAYGPQALSDAERLAINAPRGEPPSHVRGEFPPFLEPELSRAFGASMLDEMLAMQARAPIDLRVNSLRAARDTMLEKLRGEGFAVDRTPYAPYGLRLPPGTGSAKLSASSLFIQGAFEIQDEAAQLASLFCGVAPGMRVLDFAAGAGGKSLALAAAMKNKGEIVAHDITAARLKALSPRTLRAGASIVHPTTERPSGVFDVVLIDSPCSGSGTWRRQPELRWRITSESLSTLHALQDELLAEGSASVKPGGRLVYATCSILPSENEDRVAAFLAKQCDFRLLEAVDIWRESIGSPPPPGTDRFFKASPRTTGTDGFFAAFLERWTSRGATG